MNNKMIKYFLLGTLLVVQHALLDAYYYYPAYYTRTVYTAPVVYPVCTAPVIYRNDDAGAVAAGVAVGALCGIGLGALMSMDQYTYDHTCWLYFSNDVLVQWGRPQDWERKADNIQEIRYR